MAAASSKLVVRCFAEEDEALVDEWAVAVTDDALLERFPTFDPADIRPITAADAEVIVGHEVGGYSEPVSYFLEPRAVDESRD